MHKNAQVVQKGNKEDRKRVIDRAGGMYEAIKCANVLCADVNVFHLRG